MTNDTLQRILALVIVAVATVLLVRRTLARRKHPGCGSGGDCGAISPEVRKLQSKLKRGP